ncbi:MAG: deoxyribonuclease IV [Ruthenibacterium sp.]
MLTIGSHISSAGGYAAMGKQACKLGANTFAFFTRNPRGGKAKAQNPQDVAAYLKLAKERHFDKIVAHAPYTMNAAAVKPALRVFAQEMFADDLQRMEATPHQYYNFHPGSHVGQGSEVGIALIADMLNRTLTPAQSTTVLLETMAGKGSEVGANFAEIGAILERVALREKMGVCLDTCHVWDAGYDIVNDLDAVLQEFDRRIGLEKLCAIHLNDSLNACGAHKDRHAQIGKGFIGQDAFVRIINHPTLHRLPFILETPNDDAGWTEEIAMLRSYEKEEVLTL